MGHDTIIKATNRVAMLAIAALVYWMFIFLLVTVFDLKVFREHMTEMFLLSVLGIMAVLGGTVVLNIMANLSKISEAVALRTPPSGEARGKRRWALVLLVMSFPVIAGGLFLGDRLSAQRREKLLVQAAERLVAENQRALEMLGDYRFSPQFIRNSGRILAVLNKLDKSFPEVMVIAQDEIDGKPVYLGFGADYYGTKAEKVLTKVPYIHRTSKEERDYLAGVFTEGRTGYRFTAEKGNYDLYFPTQAKGRRVVLLFSDYQRYGKFGS